MIKHSKSACGVSDPKPQLQAGSCFSQIGKALMVEILERA